MWKDSNGREWSTAINVATVKRVKRITDVLLTDVIDSDLVDRLYGDVILLCNVLYAVSEPIARDRKITDEAFGELLAGDCLDEACESLMQDIIDFFPKGRRPIVERIWTATRKIEAERINLLEEKVSEKQLDRIIKMERDKASKQIDERLAELGDSSGKSQGS